jgi:hypothetical protein
VLSNIFTIDNSHLERLDQNTATRLIGNILWAECTRLNISITDLIIPFEINTKDGGIDAKIATDVKIVGDLIRDTRSYYQIKAGKNFKPQSESMIRKELFGKKLPHKENLGDMVTKCLTDNGTYVLICTHSHITLEDIEDGNKHLRYFFI